MREIRDKLLGEQYETLEAMMADVELMLDNAQVGVTLPSGEGTPP